MKSTTGGAVRAWARLCRCLAYFYAHADGDAYRLPPRPTPIPLDAADLPAIDCPRCGGLPVSGTEEPRLLITASRRFTLVCGDCKTTYVETEPRPITFLPEDYDQCPRCDRPPTTGTVAFRGTGFDELIVHRYHCAPCNHSYIRTTDGG
ncbi:hypothetical protein ACL02S_22815 [Nocardia sp. 004]|uniref:hypothetical protein n=1 Tax=Nocardia sp. 004 TaxID=3385978 RepID=UPI0039A3ED1F